MLDFIALRAGFHISTGRIYLKQELAMETFVLSERKKTRVKPCTVSFHAVPSQSTKLIKIIWKTFYYLLLRRLKNDFCCYHAYLCMSMSCF